jgi:hypothetical protein
MSLPLSFFNLLTNSPALSYMIFTPAFGLSFIVREKT